MISKKGSLVLRDVVFMIMIVSSIFVFAGLFVGEMALNYENDNMSDSWAATHTNIIANSTFYNTADNVTTTGTGLNAEKTGIWSLVSGTLDGVGSALFMVLTAPNTIGNLVGGTLFDMGVSKSISDIIKMLIVIILWVIIIFTVISAFLPGEKL